VVVLAERAEQVQEDERGVVVGEHKPPRQEAVAIYLVGFSSTPRSDGGKT
jgi:hypothetical protein